MRTTTEATTTTTTIPGTQSKSAGLTPVLYNSPGMYQDSLGGCGLGIRCCYIPTLLRGCTINISRVTVNNNKCKKAKKYQNSLGAGGPGTRCCYKATRWGGVYYKYIKCKLWTTSAKNRNVNITTKYMHISQSGTPFERHKGYVRIHIVIRIVQVTPSSSTYPMFSYIYSALYKLVPAWILVLAWTSPW